MFSAAPEVRISRGDTRLYGDLIGALTALSAGSCLSMAARCTHSNRLVADQLQQAGIAIVAV
jgi:hypothetical protein